MREPALTLRRDAGLGLAVDLAAEARYEELSRLLGRLREAMVPADAVTKAVIGALAGLCDQGRECVAEREECERGTARSIERELRLRQEISEVLAALTERLDDAEPDVSPPAGPTARPARGAEPGGPERRDDAAGGARPSLVARCLGPFQIFQDGDRVEEWNGFKSQALLKYLLLNRRRRIPKDVLCELFWPGADPVAARRNLHQAVYSLRQTLRGRQPGVTHIRYDDDCYSFDPGLDLWLDFEEFEARVASAQRHAASGDDDAASSEYSVAASIYEGDLFEERPYDDWLAPRRDALRALHTDVCHRLAEHHLQRGEYATAIGLGKRSLAQDPCDEDAHRRLIRCYLGQGQRHLAFQQYQTCLRTLRTQLELRPSPETVELVRRISWDG